MVTQIHKDQYIRYLVLAICTDCDHCALALRKARSIGASWAAYLWKVIHTAVRWSKSVQLAEAVMIELS